MVLIVALYRPRGGAGRGMAVYRGARAATTEPQSPTWPWGAARQLPGAGSGGGVAAVVVVLVRVKVVVVVGVVWVRIAVVLVVVRVRV